MTSKLGSKTKLSANKNQRFSFQVGSLPMSASIFRTSNEKQRLVFSASSAQNGFPGHLLSSLQSPKLSKRPGEWDFSQQHHKPCGSLFVDQRLSKWIISKTWKNITTTVSQTHHNWQKKPKQAIFHIIFVGAVNYIMQLKNVQPTGIPWLLKPQLFFRHRTVPWARAHRWPRSVRCRRGWRPR